MADGEKTNSMFGDIRKGTENIIMSLYRTVVQSQLQYRSYELCATLVLKKVTCQRLCSELLCLRFMGILL